MNRYNHSDIWMIWISFFIAIILQITPCLSHFYLFRPSWLILLLIYWIIIFPHRINIQISFLLGLIIDFIIGSILGIRALTFSILSYLIILKLQILRNMMICNQVIIVTLFSIITHIIIFFLEFLTTHIVFKPEIFLSSIADGILWPGLYLLMQKIRKYFSLL